MIANGYTPASQAEAGKRYPQEARRKLQRLYPDTFTDRTKWIAGHYLFPTQSGKVDFIVFLFADDC